MIMISLSELQTKEVVMLKTGKRLGFIVDFELDDERGYITSLVVHTRQQGGSLFNRMAEMVIPWEQIVTIGDDFILIDEDAKERRKIEPKENEIGRAHV